MFRSTLGRFSAAVLISISVACSGDGPTTPRPETGEGQVYTLITVNSTALPATINEGTPKVEVLEGALTLSTDSSFIVSTVMRTTGLGAVQMGTSTYRGNYSRTGTELTLILRGSTTVQFQGTYGANAVTLNDVSAGNDGDVFAFTR